ncbi:hypothetical protein BASA50_005045 [Batrachochytrium salamandrivorans]|uniref:Guanylate cyclase domain-containing protein n=1 Tax=Batrachochytrium salamandrivorans TaxID=1357716 RepID=A0ABQ8FDV2_9FUNG|nr:hypothetical protein BASA50_005045 [Batrachochytrium salamandrivorans]
MLTPALQIQCPRAGNALHVLTLDGNDRTLGLPHNALPTSQTDRGYTTAPNSNRPGSSCSAAPASIALTQPQTLIGNKDSLAGIIPRPPSKVANIPSAKTTNRQRSLRESTRTHSTNKSTEMAVSRQTRSNRIIQSAKPSTVAIKPFPSEVVPSVSPQSNSNPTSKIHRQTIAGSLMVSPSQVSHEMPQVLSSRDTPLVISTNEYKSAPRSLEKDRPLSSRHRNSYPLGAHAAGVYSKHRSSTIHSGINVPTVNAMLRDMDLLSQSRVQQRNQSSPQSSSQPTRTDTVVGNMAADTCSLEEFTQGLGIGASHTLPTVDMKSIGFHITRLTDIDSSHGKISMSIAALVRMCQVITNPSTSLVLLGNGALTALLTLIPRAIAWPDVLANINILVNVIVTENPSAEQLIIKHGGISLLLKAADQSSKAYLEMKILTEKNTNEISQGIPFDTLIDSSIVRDSVEFMDKSDKHTKTEIIQSMLSIFEKIEILLEIISCISLDLSLDDAVEQLINDASRLVDCELVLFYLVDRETDELVAYEAHSMSMDSCEREVMGKANFPPGYGIAGHAAQIGKLVCVRDPLQSEMFHEDIDYRGGNGKARSLICIPICTEDGTPFGVLELVNKLGPNDKNEYFTHEDEYLLKVLGISAGAMMANANIYENMLNTQKKVEVLLETTRSLGSILDIDVLVKMIMHSAKDLLSADRCTLFLNDNEQKQLLALIQGRDSLQEIRIPRNAGIAGDVFMSGQPINISDAYKDERFNSAVDEQTDYRTRNILCMPIKNIHGESIGVTQMINKKTGAFTIEDEKILSSFSAQAAIVLEKSQLFKKTKDMRIYLQSILSSITSCVITLTKSMRMHTSNRPLLMNALGITEEFMRENSCNKWIGQENISILNDILWVFFDGQAIYVADYEIKGASTTIIVNYQVMPLIGSKGVVIVFDDISSERHAVMTLGRYMSPELAKQVMQDNGQLGGKRKKVSILFSDIRSFTTISEGMEPTDVVEILNHHFTDAVNAITDEQGILDKFIGDAVMAVFGVPFSGSEDAVHACNTALRMRDLLVLSNKERSVQGKTTIKTGIGINTGMVLSGNIGSTKRMEFSCIGDAVNLASRTEGLTKFYGVTILVTEFSLQETGDAFLVRELEPVIVTGRKTSVRMYELLGRKGDTLPESIRNTMDLYALAYSHYKQRQFLEAADIFQQAIDSYEDGPSKILLTRCEQYMDKPPPPDWTTVYVAEEK